MTCHTRIRWPLCQSIVGGDRFGSCGHPRAGTGQAQTATTSHSRARSGRLFGGNWVAFVPAAPAVGTVVNLQAVQRTSCVADVLVDVGANHRRLQRSVPEQELDVRISVPWASRWVAKEWRSVWTLACLRTPARSSACGAEAPDGICSICGAVMIPQLVHELVELNPHGSA